MVVKEKKLVNLHPSEAIEQREKALMKKNSVLNNAQPIAHYLRALLIVVLLVFSEMRQYFLIRLAHAQFKNVSRCKT